MKNRTKNGTHSIVKLMLLIFVASVATPCFVCGAIGNVQQSALSPTSVKLQIAPGQPWRLPFGLDIVGQPPTAIVTIATEEKPAGEFVLVGYREGKEVSRQGFTLEDKPCATRICLDKWPTEAALLVKSAPGSEFVELARQTCRQPKLETLQPQLQDNKSPNCQNDRSPAERPGLEIRLFSDGKRRTGTRLSDYVRRQHISHCQCSWRSTGPDRSPRHGPLLPER